MKLAELIPLLLQASIIIVAFGFGLKARWSDATYLFRRPGELFRSFLAMNIVMLLFAIVLVKVFPLHPVVKLALVVLALSPVPPFLPGKQFKAGGERQYIYGLLIAMSVIAIVAVPLLFSATARFFNLEEHVSPALIARVLLLTILLPIGAGIAVRSWKPDLAERSGKRVLMLGNILLLIDMIFVLFATWRGMATLIGNGTLAAIIAFTMVGLIVGHLLGGPDPHHRSSLALATASRHPAVAIAIAHAAFPEEKQAVAAVLLYLIVSTIATLPYLKWCQRRQSSHEPSETDWKHRPA